MNNISPSGVPSGGKISSTTKGIIFAVISYFMWGVLPLYWSLLEAIDPFHLLGIRILLSFLALGTILSLSKNFTWLAVFKNPKQMRVIIPASIVLCTNWGLYLWAISQGRVIEASLGYYINPLVSVMLGLIFLKEKLTRLQWVAFGFACSGVLLLTVLSGALPWISVLLALCFGFYGLLKKRLKLSSLESLTAETLAAAPLGIFLLLVQVDTAAGLRFTVDLHSISYIAGLGAGILIILAFSGALTSFPLYCFGMGAKLLPLSMLGFLQFVAPTLQFLLGIFFFGELFPAHFFTAFALIWIAAILHIISLAKRPH